MKFLVTPPRLPNGHLDDACIICERAKCPTQIRYSGPLSGAVDFCRKHGWVAVGPKMVCGVYCSHLLRGLPVAT